MSSESSGLRIERHGVALVAIIDRPQAMNAINRATAVALEDFAVSASRDETVRAAVITAMGTEVFVAGGDLRELARFVDVPMGAREVLDMGSTMHAFEACDVPVIAAVQGKAFGGGCELMLACDLVVLEPHATLSFRQAAMGLSTGWGGGTRLVERVGVMNSARALLLGDPITAEQALTLGLVTEVAADRQALPRALSMAQQIAQFPRASISGIKRMLREVRTARRGDALEREAQIFASLWGGADHQAAMAAFFGRM